MKDLHNKIQESVSYVQKRIVGKADIAIVTGTGVSFGSQSQLRVNYQDIPHMPQSTVRSHNGYISIEEIGGKSAFVLNGRFHYYEGYNGSEITYPIRVLKQLGVKTLIITNAAGGLNEGYREGDMVVISDHINLQPENPLRGINDDRLGPRFPDLLKAYDSELKALALTTLKKSGYPSLEGVYACLQGPSLETPAEYNYLHHIGADLVGMSTVPEVIVARQCGLSVLALSVVSNVCYPVDLLSETTVEEVIEVVNRASPKLTNLIEQIITMI